MSLMSIVCWLVFGLVVGYIVRLLHSAEDAELNGFLPTALLGIAGSFVGGFLNWSFGWGHTAVNSSGFGMSLVGAYILCYVYLRRAMIKVWFESVSEKFRR